MNYAPDIRSAYSHLADARKELEQSQKAFFEYSNRTSSDDKKLQNRVISEEYERFKKTDPSIKKKDVQLDLETDSRYLDVLKFSAYCKDHGTTYEKEADRHAQAEMKYQKTQEEVVNALLGKWGKEKIGGKWGDQVLSKSVNDALRFIYWDENRRNGRVFPTY